jgi:hypothetical protein
VSAEAAAYAAKGNKVYPFHIGDMNLATPQNVQEAAIRAMKDGKTGYCPNWGIMPLREALAAEVSHTHGMSFTAENVAIQPGGKPVIEKFLLSLVNPGDEVLYPNPGFPIYESQIEFQGAKAVPYGFVPGKENFLLDFEAIERSITPRTRAIIFNNLLEMGCRTLAQRCVGGITANVSHLRTQVQNSIGLVTALNPFIGYMQGTAVAQQAATTGRTVYDIVLSSGLLSKEQLDEVLSPESLTGVPAQTCLPEREP